MAAEDWFRNETWDAERASIFEDKLHRARRKEQYLRIQASTIARSNPEVAHALLDRYFALPEDFDHAQAHVDRATAFLAQGRVREALGAYESALAREALFPKLLTQAYVEFPFIVATREITSEYARALEILSLHKKRLMFPVDYFKWNAAHALIGHALNGAETPFRHARAALEAASKEHSGFRYHPSVGLVTTSLDHVVARLRKLCDS